ncbi:hypothetical protein CAEBREN_04170 [Caenorhabditis brenneri]|uniref:DNA-directed DNA polymerase n=1 Tax=Caenorhabditis brenneri TaxID=135651 RepID=G0NQT8_CAEBE|nr:hypothetical protein CAEBREN_04170 [Caenorhabditis brenneri]
MNKFDNNFNETPGENASAATHQEGQTKNEETNVRETVMTHRRNIESSSTNSAPTDNLLIEQFGGATLEVLKTLEKKAPSDYAKFFKTIQLDVQLPKTVTMDPLGPENFGTMVVELIKKYTPENATTETRVGVTFDSPEFEAGTAVGLSITPIDKVSSEKIVHTMELLTQSNKSPLEIQNARLQVTLKYFTPPSGSGLRKREFGMEDILESNLFEKKPRDDEHEYEHSEHIEESEEALEDDDECEELNNDTESKEKLPRSNIMKNDVTNDCLIHAVYQSFMYHEAFHGTTAENRKRGYTRYRYSLRKSPSHPNRCGKVFAEKAGITKSRNFGYTDIQKLQDTVFAGKLQIIAIVEHQSTPYFAGPYLGKNKTITVFLKDVNGEGHFAGVRKLPALLKTKYYCCLCQTKSGTFSTHYNCPLLHRPCGALDCPTSPDDVPIRCVKCTVVFRSKTCLENHRKIGPKAGRSRCDYTKLCKKCGQVYYTNKSKAKGEHECGKKWCYRCQWKMPLKHDCKMFKSVKDEKKLTWKRFAYDFESMVDEETGEQIPVLFIAIKYCKKCSTTIPTTLEEAQTMSCDTCSKNGRCKVIDCIRDGNRFINVAKEATEWIFSNENTGFVGIAHNASGYDAQFILKSLISSNKAAPNVIMAGTKIISLRHKGVHLIDSLKYLTMSLAAVGKAFQIPTEKGDFPIKFIKRENFDYEGPLPENKFYNLNNKSPNVKAKLVDFLDEERAKGKIFKFVDELFKYCYGDVFILASALKVFEKDFEAVTNVCLFEESVTAASAAMKVFKRQHLTNKNPIVLDARPSASMKSSVISQKYMAWFESVEKVTVATATTSGERKIGNYSVDGFVEPCPKYPRGLVIEFMGCYWHAHECKYTDRSIIEDENGEEIRERDNKRIAFLEQYHEVKVVWECDVNKELKSNAEMKHFFDTFEPVDMIEMEKALSGGRTEVFKLHADNRRGTLKHVDVVSMYPAAMKFQEFPVGPPKSISRREIPTPITTKAQIFWRGFISCQILPPRQLELPLLPMKPSGKLVFALCWQCAKTSNQYNCTHSDEQRCFTGTFTTVEVTKALELGYTITKVFGAISYQRWAKNDDNGNGGLFTSYMNAMLGLKIYASGWPADVQTEEEKTRFIEDYRKQGIVLNDRDRFVESPGARLAAKLLLNSLWGKFAQRVDVPNTSVIIGPSQFWKLFHDTAVVIEDVWTLNDTVMVQHRSRSEALKSLSTGAMHIAAHVPSYGRLHLYRLMEKVGPENICYTDTDSVIYIVPHGETDPLADEMGPFLGQCTSELSGKVTKFVTTGAKSYCYKEVLANDEEKIKIKSKGISLNSEAAKRVTMEKMETLVDEVINGSLRSVVEVPQQQVRRNRDHSVFFKEVQKRFRYTFDKRRVLPDGSTLPYGFC